MRIELQDLDRQGARRGELVLVSEEYEPDGLACYRLTRVASADGLGEVMSVVPLGRYLPGEGWRDTKRVPASLLGDIQFLPGPVQDCLESTAAVFEMAWPSLDDARHCIAIAAESVLSEAVFEEWTGQTERPDNSEPKDLARSLNRVALQSPDRARALLRLNVDLEALGVDLSVFSHKMARVRARAML